MLSKSSRHNLPREILLERVAQFQQEKLAGLHEELRQIWDETGQQFPAEESQAAYGIVVKRN